MIKNKHLLYNSLKKQTYWITSYIPPINQSDIKYIKIVDKNNLNYIINRNRDKNFRQIHDWVINQTHN